MHRQLLHLALRVRQYLLALCLDDILLVWFGLGLSPTLALLSAVVAVIDPAAAAVVEEESTYDGCLAGGTRRLLLFAAEQSLVRHFIRISHRMAG